MKKLMLLPLSLVLSASALFASETTPATSTRPSSSSLRTFAKSGEAALRSARDEYRKLRAAEVKPETETTREALLRRGERFVRAGAAGARSGLTKYDVMKQKQMAARQPAGSVTAPSTETTSAAA